MAPPRGITGAQHDRRNRPLVRGRRAAGGAGRVPRRAQRAGEPHPGAQPVAAGARARVSLAAGGLSPATSLAVFSRRAFDGALLDAALDAGARLVPERVVDVTATPTGVEIRAGAERHRAAWLLGADGATSIVRRRLARPFTRAQLSVATGVFAPSAASSVGASGVTPTM